MSLLIDCDCGKPATDFYTNKKDKTVYVCRACYRAQKKIDKFLTKLKKTEKAMKKKKPKLEPVDEKQCQAEKPNGANAFTLGGRPGMVRCKAKPVYVLTENKPGKDGQRGKMSLCQDCMEVFDRQMPKNFATAKRIKK